MTTTFDTFGLPETIMKAIAKVGYTTPTPIQAQSIPYALEGRDVLGSASTGTGKTAAFAIPMIVHLINNPNSMALIMTPTRELATQVLSTIQPLLLNHREITTACLIGGEPMGRQYAQLNQKPRLVVGTPGRINDHLSRRSLTLNNADFLILDETDRMLDMGFGVQIEKIIAVMAKKRQTLMFSATLPHEIVRLSGRYLVNPQRVSVDSTSKPAANIKQEQIHVGEAEKYGVLTEQLNKRDGTIIVFVRTKRGADRIATKLDRDGHRADAIHGDLQQRKRDRVIQNYRDQKFRILVATDVAARGLDVPHIAHVINYDLPQCPEDYIHRIGRTARAGAEGEAVNLITPSEGGKWNAIVRLINPSEAKPEERDYSSRKRPGQSRSSKPHRKGGGRYEGNREWKPRDKFGDGDRYNKRADNRPAHRTENNTDTAQPAAAREQRFEGGQKKEWKKEWKPRDKSQGDNRSENRFGGERKEWKKKEWKPRDNSSSGEARADGAQKKEWKPRDRSDAPRTEGRKEWKPRDKAAGDKRPENRFGGERKSEWKKDFKPRDNASGETRSDGPKKEWKKEWKPRGQDGAKKEWKPRDKSATGGKPEWKKKEWKPRDRSDAPKQEGRPEFKKKEWKPRGDRPAGDRPKFQGKRPEGRPDSRADMPPKRRFNSDR